MSPLRAILARLASKEFRIERSATLAAPANAVFAQVNDFQNWRAWSPWERLDPALKRSYDGPASGTGAKYAWIGNRNVGEGRMTILDSRPGELVRIKLEFLRPFAATNTAEFRFEPADGGTAVTWSDERAQQFNLSRDVPLHQHGPHGRRPIRAGTFEHEERGGAPWVIPSCIGN